MMRTAILFDLDGTLLDTLPDLLDATNHVLLDAGYPAISQPRLRSIIGNGAANQIRKALPEGTGEEVVQALLSRYKAYYGSHCNLKTRPNPGIPEALAQLRDFPLAIVSNKPQNAVTALGNAFFPGIPALGESPDCPRKPAPDMVYKALSQLGADRCIYVGDSEVDILTATNAGFPCLSVTWGFRDKAVLTSAGASRLCDDPRDLAPMLQGTLLPCCKGWYLTQNKNCGIITEAAAMME